MSGPPMALESVRDRSRVGALVEHPLRLAILRAAAEPRSATEIATGLGIPRQRVNYHIGRLRRSGFLIPAERRRRRGLYEQRYRASATAYVVAPEALAPVGAQADRVEDRLSAEYLVALAAQVQGELGQVLTDAAQQDKRVATLSISTEIRFTTPEQRARFARALHQAITRVVGRYASPSITAEGEPAAGRLFRLVLGCYPPPARPPAEP
jgi:DNA-binding transcriptional ArsR family regulator